jgi:alcohol dehydrogenase YqhD (iron-dependent ADH family)
MLDFTFLSPTKIIFGRGVEKGVGNGTIGNFVKLDKKAVAEIYRRAL